MCDDVSDLGFERRKREAEDTEDSRKWRVRDMLVAAIEDIDAGRIITDQAIFIYRNVPTETKIQDCSKVSGLTLTQIISFLEIAKFQFLSEKL